MLGKILNLLRDSFDSFSNSVVIITALDYGRRILGWLAGKLKKETNNKQVNESLNHSNPQRIVFQTYEPSAELRGINPRYIKSINVISISVLLIAAIFFVGIHNQTSFGKVDGKRPILVRNGNNYDLEEVLKQGGDIIQGDRIFTYSQPKILMFDDGQSININPDTCVELVKLHETINNPKNSPDEIETLAFIHYGKTLYDIQKNEKGELFSAQTPGEQAYNGLYTCLLGTVTSIGFDHNTGRSTITYWERYGAVKDLIENTYVLAIAGYTISKSKGEQVLSIDKIDFNSLSDVESNYLSEHESTKNELQNMDEKSEAELRKNAEARFAEITSMIPYFDGTTEQPIHTKEDAPDDGTNEAPISVVKPDEAPQLGEDLNDPSELSNEQGGNSDGGEQGGNTGSDEQGGITGDEQGSTPSSSDDGENVGGVQDRNSGNKQGKNSGDENPVIPPEEENPVIPPEEENPVIPPEEENPVIPPEEENPVIPPEEENPVIPPEEENPVIPPEEENPVIPPEEENPVIPPEEENPVIPPEEENPVIPPEEENPVIPPEEENPVIPPEEENPVIPPEEENPVIPPEEENPVIPPEEENPVIPPEQERPEKPAGSNNHDYYWDADNNEWVKFRKNDPDANPGEGWIFDGKWWVSVDIASLSVVMPDDAPDFGEDLDDPSEFGDGQDSNPNDKQNDQSDSNDWSDPAIPVVALAPVAVGAGAGYIKKRKK